MNQADIAWMLASTAPRRFPRRPHEDCCHRIRAGRRSYFFDAGGATSLMMNTFSPGLMRPSSRRAISSIADGSSRSRRASRAAARSRRADGRSPRSARRIPGARAASPAARDRRPDRRRRSGRHEQQQQLDDPAVSRRPFGESGFAASTPGFSLSPRCEDGTTIRSRVQQAQQRYRSSCDRHRHRPDHRARRRSRRAVGAPLVDERLAACVNVHAPMVSVYRWKGEVERDPNGRS